jgi:hypothetical protein
VVGEYKKLSEDHPTLGNYVNSLTSGVRGVLAKLRGGSQPDAGEAIPPAAEGALPQQTYINSLTQGVRRVLDKSRTP